MDENDLTTIQQAAKKIGVPSSCPPWASMASWGILIEHVQRGRTLQQLASEYRMNLPALVNQMLYLLLGLAVQKIEERGGGV